MAIRFWLVLVFFVLGVFVRTFVMFGWFTILFLLFAALVAAVAYWREHTAPFLFTCVALSAFAFGAARMHTGIVEREPQLDAVVGEKVVIEGIVQDEPDARENNVRIPVRVRMVASSTVDSVAVLVVAPLHTEVAYGDVVRAEAKLELPEAFETGEGRVFEYPGFLAKDRILYQMSFAKVTLLGENEGFFLKSWAIRAKEKYLDGLANALNEPQAGLAGGITVGDKRGLGEELSDTFRIVGLTHIVVLSGYNIMVVVDALLRWMVRTPQALRLGFAGFVAFFFAAITGFASASTRAAAMAVIAITGKATGRTYLASRALALVATAMIIWNPYVLVFDPGFQLSIIATAGLIFLTPVIEPYLVPITERFGLREIAAASIGTQLAVVPLLLYQNGMLSLYSLPANLLALIVIPWAMLLSAIAALFGLFTGIVAPFFGFPAYVLLSYVIYVAEAFATLPLSSVQLPAFGAWLLCLIYATLGVVYKKKTAGS
ncbi:ComEC/Rec2 family competence protein [bacterium]|nr:ComEC/Rec2 family competence protein [bacterium]